MIRSIRKIACAIGIFAICASTEMTLAQQSVLPSASDPSPAATFGGSGQLFLSQFANPGLLGSLYLTPQWPMTGYYPLYPGSWAPVIRANGVLVGPLRLHPHMGVAQMYTDNVFRTNSNRTSDFLTTLAPGIQAQLPFAGFHSFIIDYRTNHSILFAHVVKRCAGSNRVRAPQIQFSRRPQNRSPGRAQART